MKTINIMLKPASSLCNMRCRYCFYADVSSMRDIPSCGIMTDETVSAMLEKIAAELDAGDSVQFTFQGGEPTLAGLPFFRRFVSLTSAWKDVRVSYALQTNGLLLDEEWCAFLAEHRFLVGLSLDILPEAHDAVRVDARGAGTYERICAGMALMKKHGVDFNVLCTLTDAVARRPKQVWEQIVRLGIEYTQFTPCLGTLEESAPSPYALTPQLFASFYTQLFAYWYADFQRGKRRSIKLFDDVVNLLVLGVPTACGINGSCHPQLVVEADGSVYPCDFYCLDEYRLGNITEQTLPELMQSPALKAFLQRPHRMPDLCGECRYRHFCAGNCKRMQGEICCSAADDFCGYQRFLDKWGGVLSRLAEQVRHSLSARGKQ